MSKQSDAKGEQGYEAKPRPTACQGCFYFKKDRKYSHSFLGKDYFKDSNLRCGLGEFAVKKTATCKYFLYS